MSSNDVESGLYNGSKAVEQGRPPDSPQASTHISDFTRRHGKSELEVFQTLVGIKFLAIGGASLPKDQQSKVAATVYQDIFFPSRAARARINNRGLYDRVVSQDMKNRVLYGMSNYIITGMYLFQIVIAAALTGLSASNIGGIGNIELTVLGAVNTVLAGVLAWLRGQGMPIRFRRARDQYREVVHAIECSERVFAEIDHIEWPEGERPTPYSERDRLEQLYNEARVDQEANYPEQQHDPTVDRLQEKNVQQGVMMEKEEARAREVLSEVKASAAAEVEMVRGEMEASKARMKELMSEIDHLKSYGKRMVVSE